MASAIYRSLDSPADLATGGVECCTSGLGLGLQILRRRRPGSLIPAKEENSIAAWGRARHKNGLADLDLQGHGRFCDRYRRGYTKPPDGPAGAVPQQLPPLRAEPRHCSHE